MADSARAYQELKIRAADHGGFVVWTPPRFDPEAPGGPLYAGSLADCLAFMGAELGKPTDAPAFDPQPLTIREAMRRADNCG